MAMRQEITQAVEGPKEIGCSEVALNGAPAGREPVGQGTIVTDERTAAPARGLELVEPPSAGASASRDAAE
jgi:hypothetical protein